MIRDGNAPPDLWAGVECTVNRVGDEYRDQVKLTGHHDRLSDLDDIARLGVKAVRYPVVWERVAPHSLREMDWAWTDERLGRLRDLGVEPIVGLVHHGSGPRYASLLSPDFAEGLATFARAVATRYPWVRSYTPVNEPGTTARFAALYGHWHPHLRDPCAFVRALINECRATALAMRAIREINPHAQLVVTEDFGKTYSTPELAHQAEHENHRRLLAIDLLLGRVKEGHPLWGYLLGTGASEAELITMAESPCAPDIIGVNYYLTSDRFLDHRLSRYPPSTHGGNGREVYADVESVRVEGAAINGHGRLIDHLWNQYRLPLAITEVHVGCTRDEQIRWLLEAWDAAVTARKRGVDLRAVTIWSTFGAVDWTSLCTRQEGVYEPGVFDVRSRVPRPTALAQVARALSSTGSFCHPGVAGPGWWHHPERILYPAPVHDARPQRADCARPLLIVGGEESLVRALGGAARSRGLRAWSLTRRDIDVRDASAVTTALEFVRPWAVINLAEDEGVMAKACRAAGVKLGALSTPADLYDQSNVFAIHESTAAFADCLVVRSSVQFGHPHCFIWQTLDKLALGQVVAAPDDLLVSPTHTGQFAHLVLDLLLDDAGGVWHLRNRGANSWANLARQAASMCRLDASGVRGVAASTLGWPVRSLDPDPNHEGALLLGPLDQALCQVVADWSAAQRPRSRAPGAPL